MVRIYTDYCFCRCLPGENLSACLYLFRILRNYEIEEGAFNFRQDLFDHVEMEKENIQPPNSTDSLSVRMICKAVNELWTERGDVLPCQRRRQKTKERGYCNLKKQNSANVNANPEPRETEEDWNCFIDNILSTSQDNWHATVNNELSVSFVRVEQVQYDGVRILTEVIFAYSVEEKAVEVKLKYHERTISLYNFSGLETQLQQLNLLDKARFLLNFIDKSTICPGFSCEIKDNTPQSNIFFVFFFKKSKTRQDIQVSLPCLPLMFTFFPISYVINFRKNR